jgi:hypothetical protein
MAGAVSSSNGPMYRGHARDALTETRPDKFTVIVELL